MTRYVITLAAASLLAVGCGDTMGDDDSGSFYDLLGPPDLSRPQKTYDLSIPVADFAQQPDFAKPIPDIAMSIPDMVAGDIKVSTDLPIPDLGMVLPDGGAGDLGAHVDAASGDAMEVVDGARSEGGVVVDAGPPRDLFGDDLTEAPDLTMPADLRGADLLIPPDMVAKEAIACGVTPCGVGVQGCCSTTLGMTGVCDPAQAGCANVQAARFDCDGPEDCGNGQVCCYAPLVGSSCTLPGDCHILNSMPMCHQSADCTNMVCCPLANTSPYGGCVAGPCMK